MLIDKIEVTFKGGDGGNGIVSFRKTGRGPDGGNGGKGGDLYIKASSDMTLLNQFSRTHRISGENGKNGGRNNMTGADGNDITVTLPIGTSLINKTTGETLVEINDINENILFAKGGKGGRGNWEFRSPTRTTPDFSEEGEKGETFNLVLSLRYIAKFGLVGLPNAGKSSLLNELTNANVKTGDYSFTTLSPNLGAYKGSVIADIPGLIEGASSGRGLGIGFLKHIEKVSVILHCISSETLDALHDYSVIKNEMGTFNSALNSKKEIILITKSDLADKTKIQQIKKDLKNKSKNILVVSINDPDSIQDLKDLLDKFI